MEYLTAIIAWKGDDVEGGEVFLVGGPRPLFKAIPVGE